MSNSTTSRRPTTPDFPPAHNMGDAIVQRNALHTDLELLIGALGPDAMIDLIDKMRSEELVLSEIGTRVFRKAVRRGP